MYYIAVSSKSVSTVAVFHRCPACTLVLSLSRSLALTLSFSVSHVLCQITTLTVARHERRQSVVQHKRTPGKVAGHQKVRVLCICVHQSREWPERRRRDAEHSEASMAAASAETMRQAGKTRHSGVANVTDTPVAYLCLSGARELRTTARKKGNGDSFALLDSLAACQTAQLLLYFPVFYGLFYWDCFY